MSVIEVKGLTHRYEDGTEALRGVDFTLEPGECVAALGANGSGKTTFVLHLNGLLTPAAGTVRVCGMDVNKANLARIRQRVGLVFQDSDEQLFMPTVIEDVMFGPLNQGVAAADAEARARKALEQTGIAKLAGRAPYHLSSGEKRRAALAGILAMDPEVLVLDEPTTFLDPPGQRDLRDLLMTLPQAKLIVTHDIPFARTLASRAVFFAEGRISAEGPVEEIVRRFNWEFR
ncbi:MAG TPA: ABC transporter ATP-binding protein [Bryobacteraceae bacterium]|jgi:cobalt/nickel transport system ATP-binding protein